MREDIFVEKNGVRTIDYYKVIGTGYERGWFSNCPVRYRFFVGARNTKKSRDIIGYESVLKILSDERRNILLIRQNDCDHRQTTYENIMGCILDLGLESSFKFSTNPLSITYLPTKQMIVFRGLNNPTSINSLTFAHGYLTDVYIEEAFEITSYADFRKLDGSLRGRLPDGLYMQITCCMNAWDKECWIYEEFFKGRLEDDYEYLDADENSYMDYYDKDYIGNYGRGLYLHKSTYKINEFRDKEIYDPSMKQMREKAPEIYKVEALGMWGNATEATYPEFNNTCIIPIQSILVGDTGKPMDFIDFAIGLDTGYSSGSGKVKKVSKNEDVSTRIKSATTMQLVALTNDFNDIVAIDEYFHSNDKSFNRSNTDNRDSLTQPQLVAQCINVIAEWMNKYGQGNSILMKGTINVYVDSADLGFRQSLELEARKRGIYNVVFNPASKISIQSRIDFSRQLMAYGNFKVCDQCKNLIRELKNSRKGEKGEPRKDTDDHAINAHEYGWAPFRHSIIRWKTFKEH